MKGGARKLRLEALEPRRVLAVTPMVDGDAVAFIGDADDDRLVLSVTDTGLLQFEANGNPATTDLGGGFELRVVDLPSAVPLIKGLTIDLGDGLDAVVFARGDLPFAFSSPSLELIVNASTETTRLETAALTAPAMPGDQLFQFGGSVVVASETMIQAHTVEFAGRIDGGQAADLDQDGDVDGHDLMDLLMKLASPPPDPAFLDGDLNGDAAVNADDVHHLLHFIGDMTGLTVVADEGVVFAGDIGDVPLSRLHVDGDARLGAAGLDPPGTVTIATIGEQSFGGAVQLLQDAVLSSTSGDVTLQGPVDGTTAGEQSLEVSTPGTTMFVNPVGVMFALENLSTSPAPNAGADDRTLIGGTIVTAGDQTYADRVLLTDATDLQSGGTVTFEDMVDGGHVLTIAAETTEFHAPVGGVAPLTSLTVNGTGGNTIFIGGSVSTLGDQVYNDAVVLTADTTLTAANVLFDESVNSDVVDAWNLEIVVTGTAMFAGRVGDQEPLDVLSVAGETTLDIASPDVSVATVGEQLYHGPLVLMQDTRLFADMLSAITFQGAVSGAGSPLPSLTVNTNGTTSFNGPVSGLLHLTVVGSGVAGDITRFNGGPITTVGQQAYEDAILLADHTALEGANINFLSTINSEPGENWDLEITVSDMVAFNAQVGNLQELRDLEVVGATEIGVSTSTSISTIRDQTYHGEVVLQDDAELSSTAGDIAFLETIRGFGDHDLALAAAGRVEFHGGVGEGGPLGALDVTGETHFHIGMPPAISVATTGGQTYHSPVLLLLLSDTVLESSMGGDITFESTVSGPGGLVVNTNGTTTFEGAVSELASLTTDDGPGDDQTDINGGSVSTVGDQVYGDAVVLTEDTLLTAANVLFERTINGDGLGPWELEINVSGNVTFQGRVGNGEPLDTLSIQGETVFGIAAPGEDSVIIERTQMYDGPVVLTQDTVLRSLGMDAEGDITFESTVSGAVVLTVTTGGTTAFHGPVTGLESLATDDGGRTDINGGLITTTGDQTFGDHVVLTAHTTLDGNDITFGQTVNSHTDENWDLEITADGTVTFEGLVGNDDPLRRLIVTAGIAFTLFNVNAADAAPDVRTTDDISLESDQGIDVMPFVAITSDQGDVTFDAGMGIIVRSDSMISTPGGDIVLDAAGDIVVEMDAVIDSDGGDILLDSGGEIVTGSDVVIGAHGDVTLRAATDITVGAGTEILAGTTPPPPALPLPELNFVVGANNMVGTFTATGSTGLLGAPGGVFFLGGGQGNTFIIQAERLRLGDHHEVAAGDGGDTVNWTFAEDVDVALDPGTTYVINGGASDDEITMTFGENVVVSTVPGTTLAIDGGAGEDRITLDHSADTVTPPAPGVPAETARLVIFQYETADGRNVRVGGFGTANPDLNPEVLPPTFTIREMETYELAGSTERDHLQVRGVQSPVGNVIVVADGGMGDVSVTIPEYTRVRPAPQTVIPAQVVTVPRRIVVDGYDCLHLIGGSGNDTIINETGVAMGATALPSLIEGEAGDDILFGGNGLDVLFAGSGVDVLHGRGGEDYLFADLALTFGGTPENPVPLAVPGVPLFPDPPGLDPADRIYGGPGLNHLAQSGLDLAVGITGMLLDGGATKDVVGWLRAQIMPLNITNLRVLLDSAFFGNTGKTGLTDAGCLISDFAVNAFVETLPDSGPDSAAPAFAASAAPALPQSLVAQDGVLRTRGRLPGQEDLHSSDALRDALFADLSWLGFAG